MSPTVQHFLLGLWLIVGGLVSVALCVAVGMRNGFHIRQQVHRKSGVVTDSTLKWFVIIGALFMGPPLLLLGVGIVGDSLEAAAIVLTQFWWVLPIVAATVATGVVGWHFLVRKPPVEGPPPLAMEQLPPVDSQPPAPVAPYGTLGDGGLGTPPRSARW